MASTATFPYFAKATIKYKSPHKQDLTFAKGETIKVTGPAPNNADADDDSDDDGDDWLVGESLDGARQGTFPSSFVELTDEPLSTTNGDSGAIPAEAPTQLQSSVLEEEPTTHDASTVPAAARDVAKQGDTETTGFGAPLPPRPESPTAEQPQAMKDAVLPNEPAVAKSQSAASVAVVDPAPPSKSDALPSKSPPPISSKPANMSSSFRDRLAAFNKPTEAGPPPVPKAKPGGWKRPNPSSEVLTTNPAATKPASLAIPKASEAAQSTSPISPTADAGDIESSGGGGFSAADAQSSIKMSLKERMAALQRNEATAADTAPEAKAKPSVPGRIDADKRSAAMKGMGFVPPSAPTRNLSVDSSKSIPDTTDSQIEDVREDGALPVVDDAKRETSKDAAPEQQDNAPEMQGIEGNLGDDEQTTEEKEAERRAAIAKRMAALGARRMGGGPAGFGARAPPITSSKASVESDGVTSSEPGIPPIVTSPSEQLGEDAKTASMLSPSEASAERTSEDAENEPKILSVPRRTAAPRKKRSAAPSPVPVTAVKEEEPPASSQEALSPIDAVQGVSAQATSDGTAAAESASEAMDTSKPGTETDTSETRHEPVATDAAHSDDSRKRSADDESANFSATEETTNPSKDTAGAVSPKDETANDVVDLESSTDTGFAASIASANDMAISETSPLEDIADKEDDTAAEESDDEVAEHQRQLDDYLRGEGFFEESSNNRVTATTAPEADTQSTYAARETPALTNRATTSPKPLSRPNSTRPPVPLTSLPPPPLASQGKEEMISQKPPTPSVDSSAPQQFGATVPQDKSNAPEVTDYSVTKQATETDVSDDEGPILAAPKPRIAMPTDDPEDEQVLAAVDAVRDPGTYQEHGDSFAAEPDDLTEEEQESQRRANLARRMAALGGQRIGAFPGMAPPPIMGAPMPARSPSKASQAKEAFQEIGSAGTANDPSELEASEETEGAADKPLDSSMSPDSPSVPFNGPPKTMSPPPPARPLPPVSDAGSPPVLPAGRPSSTLPMANLDETIRSATPVDSGISRRLSRPPVPQAVARSRDVSMAAEDANEMSMASPPLPPTSPPPRPSSRAPPLPGQTGAHRRQDSAASAEASAVPPRVDTPGSEHAQKQEPGPATIPVTASTKSLANSEVRQSSRDLDLMPSSRWWRYGFSPLRLPQTIAGRPDAILYVDTSPKPEADAHVRGADIHMLFEDYSTTVISLSFVDDDAEETQTSLAQKHNFPPSKPSVSMLRQWSTHIGAVIAKVAGDACKQTNAPIADGTPRAFVQAMICSMPDALPPVGHSLGALVLMQVGPTMMSPPLDEVRPGDVVSCTQADFRGKKGLAPYHMTFGSQAEPTSGIVIESETKKNKLRCIVQSPNNKKGLPDEVSLRLDDLKSGIVKVYRVPARQGWVQDW